VGNYGYDIATHDVRLFSWFFFFRVAMTSSKEVDFLTFDTQSGANIGFREKKKRNKKGFIEKGTSRIHREGCEKTNSEGESFLQVPGT